MTALWKLGLIVAVLSLVLWIVSLFNFYWISSSRSINLRLAQGSLSGWFCNPGDWSASEPGWHGGSFCGFVAIDFTPRFSRNAKIYVSIAPMTPGYSGPISAKAINGLNVDLPLYLPALAGGVILLAGWPARRRAIRRRRNQCERCGYDLRASTGTCPECGLVRSVIRPLRV